MMTTMEAIRGLVLICVGVVLTGLEVRSAELSCNCGWTNKGRIVGGKEAAKNEYPWMVALVSERKAQFCGASIVSRRHVLTAGHCAYQRTVRNTFAYLGSHRTDKLDGKMMKLQSMIMHPEYNHAKMKNDIAVLVTSDPIVFNQNVGPACMPSARIHLDNKKVKAIGWGSYGQLDSLKPASILQEVDLTVVPYSVCRAGWPSLLGSVQANICTQDKGKSTCNGDSGGPIVYLDPEVGRYTLVAVTSFGDKCRTPPPASNTEVAFHLPWIKEILARSPKENICTKV